MIKINTPCEHFLETNGASDKNEQTFCAMIFITAAIGFHKIHGRCVKSEHFVQVLSHPNYQFGLAQFLL